MTSGLSKINSMLRTKKSKTISVTVAMSLLVLVGYWCIAEKPPASTEDQYVATAVVAVNAGAAEQLVDIGKRHSGQDWPIFLGPTGDSKSTETGIKKNWRSSPLQQLWELEL